MNTNALKGASVWWFRFTVLAWVCLVIVIVLPVGCWDLIESQYCKYQAKGNPAEYDQCHVCGYWFSHKRMTWDKGAWMCDECWGRMYE